MLRCAWRVLIIAGLAATGYTAFSILQGIVYQAINAHLFRADASSPMVATVNSGDTARSEAAAGEPLGRITIPRLGVSVLVGEGTNATTLKFGAGHIEGTAFPGRSGNVGIAAHRDSFFRPLRRIRPGDSITLTSPAGSAEYEVEWTQVVKPSAINVLRRTSDDALTLVTCYPFGFLGKAPSRFIVRARKVQS